MLPPPLVNIIVIRHLSQVCVHRSKIVAYPLVNREVFRYDRQTVSCLTSSLIGFDDRLEDEDYDLIAENTGIQLQRKKFRRVHGNVLDSDEEDGEGQGQVEGGANTSGGGTMATMGDDSFDSTPQDEDFAQVSVFEGGVLPPSLPPSLLQILNHQFLQPLLFFLLHEISLQ